MTSGTASGVYRLSSEYLCAVPIKEFSIRTHIIVRWEQDLGLIEDIVAVTVLVFFAQSFAYFENVIRRNCCIAMIEQSMEVSTQQQPIVNTMCAAY